MKTIHNKLDYSVDEKPAWGATFQVAFQHVALVYCSIIIMPIIIGRTIGWSAGDIAVLVFVTTLCSVISTWVQLARPGGKVGAGMVLFMGPSGSYWGATQMALAMGGVPLLMTMNVLSAFIEFFIARFIIPLRRIVTPTVGGVIIMMVPLSIMPIIVRNYVGVVADDLRPNLIVFGLTLLSILVVYMLFSPKWRTLMIWVGLFVGIISSVFSGLIDFSLLADSAWFGLPAWKPQMPSVHLTASHGILLISFVVATLASSIESIGDAMAVESVSQRTFTKHNYGRIRGALYADMFGNVLSGLTGGISNTTYSSNIPLLKITRNSSLRVGWLASSMILVLALCPKLSMLFTTIPDAVLIPITLFSFTLLFITGLQMAVRDYNRLTPVIVGLSILLGVLADQQLLFNAYMSDLCSEIFSSGLTIGGISAFLLTALANIRTKGRVSYKVPLKPENCEALLEVVENDSKRKFSLDTKESMSLRLCAEELFNHLCKDANASVTSAKFVVYLTTADQIVCDVTTKAKVSESDRIPDQTTLDRGEDIDLMILNSTASNMEHLIDGNNNYISFSIKRQHEGE